jgi:hypothetical protein
MNSEARSRTRFSRACSPAAWRPSGIRLVALLVILLLCACSSPAYSIFTHEEIVDLVWTTEINLLLLKRFPALTEAQLKEAHGYAYGGAVIQDLGYYPFGSVEFSNLVHFKTRLFAILLRFMPKIGPFRALAFNNPTLQTEDMYFQCINTTVDQYRIYLTQVGAGKLELINTDFDTGKPTKAAEYALTDETYAKLLGQLTARKFDTTSPELRDNILNFYSDLSLPLETKKDNSQWQSVLASLDQLKFVARNAGVAPAASQQTPR